MTRDELRNLFWLLIEITRSCMIHHEELQIEARPGEPDEDMWIQVDVSLSEFMLPGCADDWEDDPWWPESSWAHCDDGIDSDCDDFDSDGDGYDWDADDESDPGAKDPDGGWYQQFALARQHDAAQRQVLARHGRSRVSSRHLLHKVRR